MTLPPTPPFVADFDSTSAMLRATARYLRGEDFPALGLPRWREPLAIAVNLLPRRLRRLIYIWGGRSEAIPPERLADVRAESIARWAVDVYPRRSYPALAIGASNGALVHLYAALGIPWLPQTVLIPVRQNAARPDDPRQGMEFGREHGRRLLDANPDLQLHHMHDPNQDRLMLHRMTYFRTKRLRLGAAYEEFITETLPPGGTIILVDCRLRWPTTQVGERHFFQFGGYGGASPREYFEGGERVSAFLHREGSALQHWDPPTPDGQSPEAEWGFEPGLALDVERLASRHGYRIVRLAFDEPEEVSASIAELCRHWYAGSGVPARRLLVESFILLEPMLAARTRSVPFWTTFSTEGSVRALEQYLAQGEHYDEVAATLFAHGVESVGVALPAQWDAAIARAGSRSALIGNRARAFPADFAVFARFYRALAAVPERFPVPESLSMEEAEAAIAAITARQDSGGLHRQAGRS